MPDVSPTPPAARNLVTGVTGFVGGYLADALLAAGEAVIGLSRGPDWPPAWRHLAAKVPLTVGGVEDAPLLDRILHEFQPTRIYHLAGYARVGASFKEPDAAWVANLDATRRLCEAVNRWGGNPRILFVGSGMVYGAPRTPGKTVTEEDVLRPDTPYAASKAAADLACYQYACAPGLDIVRARPFNHTGPHQSPEFAVPNFARQLVAIERRLAPPVLETGDLTPERDLSDVRDVVAAYRLLMAHGRRGEAYNIASGQTHSMRAILDRLLALTGLRVEVRQSEDLMRPTEPLTVRVDVNKLRYETGWRPRYSLDDTLRDTLEAWRSAS